MNQQKFKRTEIGMIPEDWEVNELKDVLEDKGYIRGPFGSSLRRPELKSEGIPVYEQEHAIYNSRRFRYFIDNEKFQELSRFAVKENDLIISCSGTFGKVSILRKEDPKGIISQALLILRPNTNKINPLYLKYFFTSDRGFNSIASRSLGSVQVNIAKREIIEKIELPLPPLPEQRAIAKILSDLDSKIELNQQMNKTLEAIGQAIFKHWFIDFEFPNDDGKPYKSSGGEMVFNQELGREIPKGWEVKLLSSISHNFDSKRVPLSSRERNNRKGIFPYYGANGILDYIDEFIFDGTYLLMGEDGTVISDDGSPILQYVWGRFWVNNHAHVLQGTSVSTELLWLLLKNTNVSSIITGAVQLKINQQNMNKLMFVLPAGELLSTFNVIVKELFMRLKNISEEIVILSQIRDSLLPKFMSGKVRVPVR